MVDFLPDYTFATEFSLSKKPNQLSLDDEERIFNQITLQQSLWHKPIEMSQSKPLGFLDREIEGSDEDEQDDDEEDSQEEISGEEEPSQEGEEEEDSLGVDQEADDYGVQ